MGEFAFLGVLEVDFWDGVVWGFLGFADAEEVVATAEAAEVFSGEDVEVGVEVGEDTAGVGHVGG